MCVDAVGEVCASSVTTGVKIHSMHIKGQVDMAAFCNPNTLRTGDEGSEGQFS